MSVFLAIQNEFDNFDKLLQLGNSNRIDRKKIPTYPSFAVVCTINSIKVVKYQQINAK